MKAKINYNAAIYCRLSREDGEGESNSITNQKAFISEYIIKRGFNIYKIYVDDGYTGTSFNRPAFKEMIQDIENGLVDLVVTKDLSRLGRDYINAGYYIEEYFPKHNIRYIAINDNYDSLSGEGDDFVPLKNVINEFYAKDISKKVRATKTYQQKKGIQRKTAYPLYGYMFNEEGKRIINPETAPIVKRIFEEFTINRKTIKQIVELLKEEHIYRPCYYNYIRYGKKTNSSIQELEKTKYDWKYHSIEAILSTIDYTGVLVTPKTKKISFKIKIQKDVPLEERYYFENAFEPIITKDLYELTQSYRLRYKNAHNAMFDSKFRGICYCPYCQNKMYLHSRRHKTTRYTNIYCETKSCTIRPKITGDFLTKVLFHELKIMKEYIIQNEEKIIEYAIEKRFLEEKINSLEKQELEYLKQEYLKYEKYLKKLFELYASDIMNLEEYNIRIKEYRSKQEELQKRIDKLTINEVDNSKRDFKKETEQIINIFKSYNFETEKDLNHYLILALINKIYIGQEKPKTNYYANKGINIIIEYRYVDEVFKGFMYERQFTNTKQTMCNICTTIG